MRSNEMPSCFTRVVVDGDYDIELVELQAVMQRIQCALQPFPAAQRMYLGNALLNLAITHMLKESGAQRTSTVLIRLIDAVLESETPPAPEAAIDLTARHS